MRTLVCVYTIEEVAHAHVQNAPLGRFLSIPWAGGCVQGVEQDLQVVYPVIRL